MQLLKHQRAYNQDSDGILDDSGNSGSQFTFSMALNFYSWTNYLNKSFISVQHIIRPNPNPLPPTRPTPLSSTVLPPSRPTSKSRPRNWIVTLEGCRLLITDSPISCTSSTNRNPFRPGIDCDDVIEAILVMLVSSWKSLQGSPIHNNNYLNVPRRLQITQLHSHPDHRITAFLCS